MSENKVYFDVLTPVNFLSRSASVYPEKLAVVHGEKRFTYKEFYARVNRLASALKKYRRGQRGQGGVYLSEHASHAGGPLCCSHDRRRACQR